MLKLAMFDPLLHQPIRTQIVSLIACNSDGVSFTQLLEATKTTNGNLSTHLRILEDHGYVIVTKTFENRRPKSIYTLSEQGLNSFLDYLDMLQQFMNAQPKKR